LRKFIDAAIYTGSGEFIELVYGTKGIERITRQDIFKVYDYKTAYYTFACPLAIGAILVGTDARQVNLLLRYGLCVGRAFQIKDDILGIFSEETEIGKSNLTDLQEGKKTLLVWHAYRNASRTQKAAINKILGCAEVTRNDLLEMRRIMTRTKSLEYARRRVVKLLKQSQRLLACSHIKPRYKASLLEYAEEILAL
jgi:geranylgeranyl diphosphate synthase type I